MFLVSGQLYDYRGYYNNSDCDIASGHMALFLFDIKDTGKQDARALLSSLFQLSNQSDYFYDVLLRFLFL